MSATSPTTQQLYAYAQYTSLRQELSNLLNQLQQIPNPPTPPQAPTTNTPDALANYYSSLAEYYQNLQSYSQNYGNTISQNIQTLQEAMQIINKMEGLLKILGVTDPSLQQVADQISQNINYYQQLQNATQLNYSTYIAFFSNLANAYSQISQYQQLPPLPQAPSGSVSLTEASQYYSNLANWLTQNSSTVQQNISALQGAIQALQAALNNVPPGYDASQLQQQLQQWQQALAQLQNLENLNPQQLQNTATAYSLWAQGISALNQGDYQDAVNDFNQALQAVGLSPPSSPTQRAPSSWAALFYLDGLANALLNAQNIQNQYQPQLNQLAQQISSQEGGNISPQLLQTISQFYSTLSQELAQVRPYFEQASRYGAKVGVQINVEGYNRASKLAADLAKLASDMANALQQLNNASTQNPGPANQAVQILMSDQDLVDEINSLASSLPSSFSSLATDAQSLVNGYNELTKSSVNAYTFYSGVKQIQQYLNQQDYQDAYKAAEKLAKSLGISVSIDSLTEQSYQPPSNDPEVETVYYLLLLSKWGLTYQSITNQYQQQINSLASSINSSDSMEQTFSTYAQIFNLMSQMYNDLQQITPAANAAFSYFGEPTFPQNYFATAAELMKKASNIASRIANDLADGDYDDIEKIQLDFSELSQLQSMNNSLTQGMTSSIQQNIANFAIAVANLQYNIAFTNAIDGALRQVNKQQNKSAVNQFFQIINQFFRGRFGDVYVTSNNSPAQSYQQLSQAYAQAAQQIETIAQKQASGNVEIPGVGTVNVHVSSDLINSAYKTAQKMKLLSQAYNALAQASQNSNDPQTALRYYKRAYDDFTQAGVSKDNLSDLQSVITFYQYLASNQRTLQNIQNKLQTIGNLTPKVNGNSVQLGSATLVASAASMPLLQMRRMVEQATGLDQIKQQIDNYYDNFPSLPRNLQRQVDKMHKIANTTVDLYTNILVARAYSSITQIPNVSTDQQIQALENAKQALEDAKQDAQTLQSLGISIDPSQIQKSIDNINQSINEIQTVHDYSQQLQNILKQIQNQLQTPQTAESLTSNLMNLASQGLQIINNIIATYQKYGQSPDQSILSLQKKLQKIYDNARNEYKTLTGPLSVQSIVANIVANLSSLVGTAINDGLNDISNFITHAIPGLAGQIIAGIVIGALFSLLQLIPGVNVAVDTAIGITIMAATMGAAVQQYYLSGISDWKTIAFDIAKSFVTPEGIAALLSGVGFSIGLPRVVDNVGDLFKTTNNVKVSGVVKSLDKTKIDLDNIQTKV
ncbi:MAG: magnesium transporter, partial [Saccharolobus sp.]